MEKFEIARKSLEKAHEKLKAAEYLIDGELYNDSL